MKVISLLQPWATLMAEGHKTIETRSWQTRHRGPLLIHASAKQTGIQKELAAKFFNGLLGEKEPRILPTGAIIGMVTLVDVFIVDDADIVNLASNLENVQYNSIPLSTQIAEDGIPYLSESTSNTYPTPGDIQREGGSGANNLSVRASLKIVKEIMSDKTISTVMHCDKPTKNDLHPTMKPILLLAPLIENSSTAGQLVLDTFAGSGSTMVTCHQMKRTCYAMDNDPKYCHVIIDRMLALDPTLKVKINGKDWKPKN